LWTRPAPGLLTVAEALAKFPIAKPTLLRWVQYCPTLGRAAGLVHNGRRYLRQADLRLCLALRSGADDDDSAEDASERMPCPGNTGTWDGARAIYTEAPARPGEAGVIYLAVPAFAAACGASPRLVRTWVGNGKAPDGGPLDCKRVLRPSMKNPHGGKVTVIAAAHAERIRKWRQGEDKALWQEDNQVLGDGVELWATNLHIEATFGKSEAFTRHWCLHTHPALDPTVNGGRLRRRKVCKPAAGPGPNLVRVYALEDVRKILSWGNGQGAEAAETASSAEAEPALKQRGRKYSAHARAVGELCYRLLSTGTKRRVICRKVREQFSRIMNEPDVTTYARRYARHAGKPWPVG
jgi:hypothetical protein